MKPKSRLIFVGLLIGTLFVIYLLRIRSSKADQEGEGADVGIARGQRADTCPVRAIETWLRQQRHDLGLPDLCVTESQADPRTKGRAVAGISLRSSYALPSRHTIQTDARSILFVAAHAIH